MSRLFSAFKLLSGTQQLRGVATLKNRLPSTRAMELYSITGNMKQTALHKQSHTRKNIRKHSKKHTDMQKSSRNHIETRTAIRLNGWSVGALPNKAAETQLC